MGKGSASHTFCIVPGAAVSIYLAKQPSVSGNEFALLLCWLSFLFPPPWTLCKHTHWIQEGGRLLFAVWRRANRVTEACCH